MTDKLITIASGHAAKLSLYQSKLETEGIFSFIADESMVKSPARLQVKESDAEKTLSVLGFGDATGDGSSEQENERCPHCNSTDIEIKNSSIGQTLRFMLTGKHHEPKLKCRSCGHEWNKE